MDQPWPQLRVVDEGLRWVAEDRLDLGAHISSLAAVGDGRVGHVNVDRRRDALDEHAIARVGLSSLEEGHLELVTGLSGPVEQPALLMNEQRLPNAGQDDDAERRGVHEPEIGCGHMTGDDQDRAAEESDQRQGAMDRRGRPPGAHPGCLAEPPAGSTEADHDDAEGKEVVDEAACGRRDHGRLAQPLHPGQAEHRETGEEQIAATRPKHAADRQQGDETGSCRGEMEDRVGDRHRSGERSECHQVVAMHGEDGRGDRQEHRRGVEVDGYLLGTREAATNCHEEGQDDRHHDAEISHIRRRGKAGESRRDLDVPAQLAEGPRKRTQGNERAHAALQSGRAMRRARGDRHRDQAAERRVGGLPGDHQPAGIDCREEHENAHQGQAGEEDHRDGDSIPESRAEMDQASLAIAGTALACPIGQCPNDQTVVSPHGVQAAPRSKLTAPIGRTPARNAVRAAGVRGSAK